MKYTITSASSYLVAQLIGCETPGQMREFLRAVVAENRTYRHPLILLDVRSSRPLFQDVERLRLFDSFKQLSAVPSCKIALLGDTRELCLSHEYLVVMAQQQGLNVRSFQNRAAMFNWLNEQRRAQDRRLRNERRQWQERRGAPNDERRQQERRAVSENRQQA